jgi:adenylate kinase
MADGRISCLKSHMKELEMME